MKRGIYRKAVFVVAYRLEAQGVKYLILKRKLHWKGWEFPKGGKDGKETDKQTALREVKEETGLKILKLKAHKKSGKYKYNKEFKDRPGIIGQTYKLFSAEVSKGKIRLDKKHKEHSSSKWVDFNNAIKLLTHSTQRTCLRIVNKSLK